MSEIIATYAVETPLELAHAADLIAGEQSTGTFLSLAAETDAIRGAHRAKVISIEGADWPDRPALRSAYIDRHTQGPLRLNAGIIKLAFPAENIGRNLPTLLATLAGNVFELGQLTGIRLMDFSMATEVSRIFHTPRVGVCGTRKAAAVEDRPIFGTIIKPNLGLNAEETAEVVSHLCEAGIDFIKDDEVLGNPPFCSFNERFSTISRVLEKHFEKSGRRVLYAFNISDHFDSMRRSLDQLEGCPNAVAMISLNWVGYAAAEALRDHTPLPIHGHRNGFAGMTRCSKLGISGAAYVKSWRLAGVDHLHVNGFRSKFWESDDSVAESAHACTEPLGDCGAAMPVFSSGQWAGTLPRTAQAVPSGDFLFLCGGGIFGHPDGAEGGVRSVHQAWEAIRKGARTPKGYPALEAAYQAFKGL